MADADPKVDPEYQELLPPLEEGEYESLRDSIKEHGLQLPIEVSADNRILDGYSRFKACKELHTNPTFRKRTFKDRLAEKQFVIMVNLQRRHLNDFQKIEISQLLLETEREAAAKRQGARTDLKQTSMPLGTEVGAVERVAHRIGVSKRTYHRGLAVLKRADEPLKKKLRKGEVEINTAYVKIETKKKQDELVEQAKGKPTPGNVQLYLGDFESVCRHSVAPGSIDLLLTDPPYALKEFSLEKWEALATTAKHVLKPGAFLVTYTGQEHLPEVIERLSGHLDWFWIFADFHSANQTQLFDKKIRNRYKPLLVYTNGKPRDHEWMFDALTGGKGSKELYEEAQADDEAAYFIEKLTKKGELVLDPLLGSGTTIRAAYKLGRLAIGIEKDEHRLEVARSSVTVVTK